MKSKNDRRQRAGSVKPRQDEPDREGPGGVKAASAPIEKKLRPGVLALVRSNISALLAFSLLLVQIAIPWSVKYFVTDDGSSHLYTAIVTRSLLFNFHSAYSSVYQIHRGLVPNWGGTFVFGLIASLVGVDHAEKVVASLAICAGFFAFAYAVKALAPESSPWTPLANFVLNVWFLAAGYYSFYIGILMCPLIVGYYIRHAQEMTFRRAGAIAGGLLALFFTHIVGAAVAIWTLSVVGFWIHGVAPWLGRTEKRDVLAGMRRLGVLALAIVPVVALMGAFAASSAITFGQSPTIIQTLEQFPGHLFETGVGPLGLQVYLWPVALCLIVVGTLSLGPSEWRSARAGVAIAAFGLFLAYLLLPDEGMGGNDAKVRFEWAGFVIGSLIPASAGRLRPTRTPFALYISLFLLANLHSMAAGVSAVSAVAEQYLTAADQIRPGSNIVRMRYGISSIPDHYGYRFLRREPVTHLDSFAAARCGCIDLSDFQAPSAVFPVVFKPEITSDLQSNLWTGMEAAGFNGSQTLAAIRKALPVPIDYVIVLADAPPESIGSDYATLSADLNSKMRAVASTRFMTIYQRNGP